MIEQIGDYITNIGLIILPYSFAMYLPLRWLEHIWKMGYSKLVKAIWYLALGLTYFTGGIEVDIIVMYICFIEAIDLCFQQLQLNKMRNPST